MISWEVYTMKPAVLRFLKNHMDSFKKALAGGNEAVITSTRSYLEGAVHALVAAGAIDPDTFAVLWVEICAEEENSRRSLVRHNTQLPLGARIH
jgi:hypothetical protein